MSRAVVALAIASAIAPEAAAVGPRIMRLSDR